MLKLKKRAQFQKIYKKGTSFRGNNIVLCLCPNDLKNNRVGVSVTSRVAPLSVRRNRAKRLLLESYRNTATMLTGGHDIVFVSRKDISRLHVDIVKREMLGLCGKAGILA